MASASVRVLVNCPHCKARYSGPQDETHEEGCPQPLKRQLEQLEARLVVNTCPASNCGHEVLINGQDLHECTKCHARYIAPVFSDPAAVYYPFRVEGRTMYVIQMDTHAEYADYAGMGQFPRKELVDRLQAQVIAAVQQWEQSHPRT